MTRGIFDMKERPIILSGPMVRAILAGAKTQTRRVVKPQAMGQWGPVVPCPYGRPGDRLWVREAWRPVHGGYSDLGARYRADFERDQTVWRPSIHMPRWASRITLEVTGVRVERLQDISEADAQAEGSFEWAAEQDTPVRDLDEARLVYLQLWQSINGPASWDADPWVWVVEFRRLPA